MGKIKKRYIFKRLAVQALPLFNFEVPRLQLRKDIRGIIFLVDRLQFCFINRPISCKHILRLARIILVDEPVSNTACLAQRDGSIDDALRPICFTGFVMAHVKITINQALVEAITDASLTTRAVVVVEEVADVAEVVEEIVEVEEVSATTDDALAIPALRQRTPWTKHLVKRLFSSIFVSCFELYRASREVSSSLHI